MKKYNLSLLMIFFYSLSIVGQNTSSALKVLETEQQKINPFIEKLDKEINSN
jgi:hypothetical protein